MKSHYHTVVISGAALIAAGLVIGHAIGARSRPVERDPMQDQLVLIRRELDAALSRAAEADEDTARLLQLIDRAKVLDVSAAKVAKGGETSARQFDARRAEADALWQAGKMQEALAGYLWCYENGPMKDRHARGGIRLVLGRMAKTYPPAFAALESLRHAAHMNVAGGAADAESFQELLMLNRELGDKARNLQLFDGLIESDPRRKQASIVAFDILVEHQRYEDAVKIKPLAAMLTSVELWAEHVKKAPNSRVQAALTEAVANDVEALAGAGKLYEARVLVRRLLEIDPTGSAPTIVEQRLRRVGRGDLLATGP